MPPLSISLLRSILANVFSIAEPANLVKMLRRNSSSHSTPAHTRPNSPFTAPHPATPGGVVMLVAEIANILLAGNLLPEVQPHQHAFARFAGPIHDSFPSSHGETSPYHVQAVQISQLVKWQCSTGPEKRLSSTETGTSLLQEAEKTALRWWSELVGGGSEVDGEEPASARKNSLFHLSGSIHDEEVELSVAVIVSPSDVQRRC